MTASHVFDDIPTEPTVEKKEFKKIEPTIRMELVDLQQQLRQAGFSVMVVFAGVDGAGKHEMVNLLNSWMDPRGLIAHGYEKPDAVEVQRPPAWRYWRDLPSDGQIGLYLSAWYSQPLVDRVHRRISREEFLSKLNDIYAFERTLSDNGVLLIKVWMHLDKKSQRKRLEKLASKPETEWQVKSGAWENWGLYSRFIDASEEIIHSSPEEVGSWLLVDGREEYTRQLKVAYAIRDALKERLSNPAKIQALSASAWTKKMKPSRGSLRGMDLTLHLEKEEYKKRLKKVRRKLYQLQHQAKVAGLSTVLVFEGQDAAGKGGAIRRLVQGLDAREYQVIPIAAPSSDEIAHHYLWRFWLHLPKKGRVTIFDRSWYGRVLVERVEGFATPGEWQQAYREINEFEKQLSDHQTVVCKFWIQIDKEEQLSRFKAREETPYKQWKITDEDWRNREKWDEYDKAVDDMVSLTHTDEAPWVLVEGNDKYWSRIKVLETVCSQIEYGLDQMG